MAWSWWHGHLGLTLIGHDSRPFYWFGCANLMANANKRAESVSIRALRSGRAEEHQASKRAGRQPPPPASTNKAEPIIGWFVKRDRLTKRDCSFSGPHGGGGGELPFKSIIHVLSRVFVTRTKP